MHPRKRQRKSASAMKLVGKLVGVFRTAAGLTQAQLAELVGHQAETIASIEQGRRALLPDLARQLDRLLETAVENMPEVDLIPAWAEEYLDLEREALALSWFENQVLPGLLQTENYARAVFRSKVPVISEDDIVAQAATRLERQEILHRPVPPTTSFIISEAILRDRLGGNEVYTETLRHLCTCSSLPGITLQVMPLGRQTHAALAGPFILLETPNFQHLVYTETQRGSQIVADPDEVSILAQKYAMLRTQALNTEDTKGLLENTPDPSVSGWCAEPDATASITSSATTDDPDGTDVVVETAPDGRRLTLHINRVLQPGRPAEGQALGHVTADAPLPDGTEARTVFVLVR
ncbi:helix-turn-helix domain-containing protein [Streptomyces finlayi]|uniref:Helix-turn-helix domain-containing protein n=1 Tax=Streptomyces finlayi TaxID=67296 RepID=A0A7G7BMZ4_9ACTN|nr:helix-turn-helix transcriptional regulator [Streptomyces finlayi]QNE76709.1 helix-turn-helix domain-containing protein [Streptomyces finlayi]